MFRQKLEDEKLKFNKQKVEELDYIMKENFSLKNEINDLKKSKKEKKEKS